MSDTFVHDERFVEAFSNADHVVYGRRLAPFSLWHQFNLELAQSKILLGEPLTPLDLWVAVRVCSTPWTPQHRKPNLKAPGLLSFLWQTGRYNFAREVNKFSAYLQDYHTRPKLWPNSHKQSQGVPDRDFDENLELALHLMREGHFTWREVWTLPIGMLHWCSVGLSKLGGAKIDIWTPEHEAMFEEHKRQREAGIDARGREIAAAQKLPFEEARQKAHDEYWAKVKQNYGHAEQPPQHRRQSGKQRA